MNHDLDQPFGRRFADRKDQRGNGDDLRWRFRECNTLREMAVLAHETYRVPMDKVQAIVHGRHTRAVRAMNLVRAARHHRLKPRKDSLGRATGAVGRPRTKRRPPWEV